jgi:hypothetical protein
LQAVITLLKSNFTNPDTVSELSRATVEGLMVRLPRGVILVPGRRVRRSKSQGIYARFGKSHRLSPPRVAQRRESQAIDKAWALCREKGRRLIGDLPSQGTNDLQWPRNLRSDFAGGKPLFTLRNLPRQTTVNF